ncbi:Crp/Fnr family transcriptional regulator [Larkinella bovis]|uniref:Crp/Fnr family transcriptional regulator n=1 Tax=Larkinella bovis TaxID=683041 RepID=A0ABW0IA20_9BACT
MAEPLIQHLRKFVAVKDEEIPAILHFFQAKSFKKKENLVEEGDMARYHYFVRKGCLRLFYVNDKGVEQTTQFAIENWWLTDYLAFQSRQPTRFYIQAVENTDVLAIDLPAQEQLFEQFPQMERYFRLIYQRAFGASQWRIRYLYDLSREELYYHFSDHYPEFIQRIPQFLLASFLGFTPEYLSEIRKKKRS